METLVGMKRVELHRITAGDPSVDQRYIVEMFDDVDGNAPPVALGHARFRPGDGACCLNIVSRGGVHQDDHAQAALAAMSAFRRFIDAARPPVDAARVVVRPKEDASRRRTIRLAEGP